MKNTDSNIFLASADFKIHLHPSVFQQPGWFWELLSVLTVLISIWHDLSEITYFIQKYKQSLEKEPMTPHFPSGETDLSCTHYFYLCLYKYIEFSINIKFFHAMRYKFKRWVFSPRIINNWVLKTTWWNLQGQVLLRKRENSIWICHVFNLFIQTFQQIWYRLWTVQHWQKAFLIMINYYFVVYEHDQLLVDKFYIYRLQVAIEEWIWGLNVVCLKSQVKCLSPV